MTASLPADRTAISDEAVRVGHQIRAFINLTASARPFEPVISARHTAIGKHAIRAIGAGFIDGAGPVGDQKARRQNPSKSRTGCRRAGHRAYSTSALVVNPHVDLGRVIA